jgi:hypothetical protein
MFVENPFDYDDNIHAGNVIETEKVKTEKSYEISIVVAESLKPFVLLFLRLRVSMPSGNRHT